MDRKTTFLAVLVGLALAASASMATAHERTRVYWTTRPCGCVVHVRHVVRLHRVAHVPVRYVAPLPPAPPPVVVEREVDVVDNSVALPLGFFADSGGVGPAFIDTGGGGGGFVIEQAGAQAFAGAHASASATISIAFRGRGHNMPPMKMMPHGCNCGGHKW
ncbi:MAG TPA: hypothetical protein VGL73_16945 [Caulobacteraceae bacterium]|jgi:hypothetical protein